MKLALFLFLLSVNAYSADWLCSEVAAQRQGSSIIVCGIGSGKTEAEARQDALEKARQEFEGICEQSKDCRNHETLVKPMRNACEATQSGFTCHRAFQYEILEEVKEEPSRDIADIGDYYPQKTRKWRLQLGVGYSDDANYGAQGAPNYFCCGTFDANLQRKLFWRVSLGLRFSYRAGTTSNLDTTMVGIPGTSEKFVTSSSGKEFAISLPVETVAGFFLVPEAGLLLGNLTLTTQKYGADGQGTWTTATSTATYQNYFVGGQLRYQSGLADLSKTAVGVYYYLGYKKYFNMKEKTDSGAVNGGIGIQFGF